MIEIDCPNCGKPMNVDEPDENGQAEVWCPDCGYTDKIYITEAAI